MRIEFGTWRDMKMAMSGHNRSCTYQYPAADRETYLVCRYLYMTRQMNSENSQSQVPQPALIVTSGGPHPSSNL